MPGEQIEVGCVVAVVGVYVGVERVGVVGEVRL